MSQMNSHRPDPVPVVEGSAIGIIPNPMSGRDIRRIISPASVFPTPAQDGPCVIEVPAVLAASARVWPAT